MHIAHTLPDMCPIHVWQLNGLNLKTHAHNPICLINLSEPIECSDVRYYFLNLLFTYKCIARNFIYYCLLPPKKIHTLAVHYPRFLMVDWLACYVLIVSYPYPVYLLQFPTVV